MQISAKYFIVPGEDQGLWETNVIASRGKINLLLYSRPVILGLEPIKPEQNF